jgi:hypothetical protein
MATQSQFHLRRLFVWTSYFAALLGCFGWLPSTPQAFAISMVFAVAAFLIDFAFLSRGHLTDVLSCSYFSLAIAMTIVVSYVSMCILPVPTPPTPPVPLLTLVYEILSGHVFEEFGKALAQLVLMILLYFWTFCFFTVCSVVIAILFAKTDRSARMLLLANLPSVLFLIYAVIIAILDG